MEDLFLEHRVNMYLCGHLHSYELHWPIAKGKATQKSFDQPPSPVYLVQGAGGNIESYSSYADAPKPSYTRYFEGSYWGVGLMTVNRTAIRWEMYSAQNSSITDSMVLTLSTDL